jgi:hypothetical protein
VDLGGDGDELAAPPGLRLTRATGPRRASLGAARAAAVAACGAPVVAFIEDHCYPDPTWAEALIRAYREPWAAVGYVFRVANPESYVSRASALAEYAPWLQPHPGGRAALLPNANVSYRREVLARFGSGLPGMLEIDFDLQEALRRRRMPMAVEPRAVAAHECFERIGQTARADADYGRLLAARRSRLERWPRRRRLLYAAATPVFSPIWRLAHIARHVARRPARLAEAIACLPAILVIVGRSGLGEAQGYLGGEGDALERFHRWELEAPRAPVR